VWAYSLLALSLVAVYWIGPVALNRYSLFLRGLLGGALYAVPVGFAGIIFSSLFRQAKDGAAAFASNLLGAVVGGGLEYSSMFFGLRAMVLMALALYFFSFLIVQTRQRSTSDAVRA